jgi:hypothetical protein
MIEIFEKYGFTHRGTCHCLGPKTHKYKRGDYAVYWNKAAKKFRVKHHGKPITTLINENELEATISKYFPLEAAA